MTITINSHTDISDSSTTLSIISNSLLITDFYISSYFFQSLCCQVSKKQKKRKEKDKACAKLFLRSLSPNMLEDMREQLSFTSTNLPTPFVHNLTIARNRVAMTVSGYG